MAIQLPIYLDNHSTTRVDPRVVQHMMPFFTEQYGNAASRSHTFGYVARSAVEKARDRVATAIGASPKEIVLTSGATESNNIAILGAARKAGPGHIITVATEHKAVLDPCKQLVREGFTVTVLPVDGVGQVDLTALDNAFQHDTRLVSAMAVNNETGTCLPLAEIGRRCRDRNVLFHCDAAQAPHCIALNVVVQNIDLLSLSAHKIYGPKGVGALYVRRGAPRFRVSPLFHGGGHERGMRSGTIAVPMVVAMGHAAEYAVQGLHDGTTDRIRALRDRLFHGLQAGIDGVVLNGAALADRSGNNLNVSFERVEAEALLMAIRDLAVSTGSACTSASLEPSHVLRAMGIDNLRAHSSIRFGLGRFTTEEEVDFAIGLLTEKVVSLRAMSPLYQNCPVD